MPFLTISIASTWFHMVAPAQSLLYLLYKFLTKSARNCFKPLGMESHEYDKHTKYFF